MKKTGLTLVLIFKICFLYSQVTINNDTLNNSGTLKYRIVDFNNLPFLAGEMSLTGVLDLLPGNQKIDNYSNQFSVFGSPSVYNLLTIDNAPIYTTSNFKINSSVIREMNEYQIDKPFKYNQGISSITELNIHNKTDRFKLSGQLTPLSTQLTTAVPVTEKIDFLLSCNYQFGQAIANKSENFRKIYRLPSAPNDDMTNKNYDFLAKLNFYPTKSNQFSLTYFNLSEKYGYNTTLSKQTNSILSLNWLKKKEHIDISNCLTYSNRNIELSSTSSPTTLKIISKLNNIRYLTEINHIIKQKHTLNCGISLDYFIVSPNSLKADDNSLFHNIDRDNHKTLTTSIYATDNYKLSDWFSAKVGIKYTVYNKIGKGVQYNFNNYEITDSVSFGKGEIMKTYSDVSPVICLSFYPTSTTSIQIDYYSSKQYIKSYSEQNSELQLQEMYPSTNNFHPTKIKSLYFTFMQLTNKFVFKLIPFYRLVDNLLEPKDNAMPLLDKYYENEFLFGEGTSYGCEFLIQKRVGKLTGWIDYAYTKSTRKFDAINFGESCDAAYNHYHKLNLVLSYQITENWNISSVFKYYPGANYSRYDFDYINGMRIPVYRKFKQPDSYRLDLTVNYMFKSNKLTNHFSLGLYNLFDDNTIDYINDKRDNVIYGISPYIKYRFDL